MEILSREDRHRINGIGHTVSGNALEDYYKRSWQLQSRDFMKGVYVALEP